MTIIITTMGGFARGPYVPFIFQGTDEEEKKGRRGEAKGKCGPC